MPNHPLRRAAQECVRDCASTVGRDNNQVSALFAGLLGNFVEGVAGADGRRAVYIGIGQFVRQDIEFLLNCFLQLSLLQRYAWSVFMAILNLRGPIGVVVEEAACGWFGVGG